MQASVREVMHIRTLADDGVDTHALQVAVGICVVARLPWIEDVPVLRGDAEACQQSEQG